MPWFKGKTDALAGISGALLLWGAFRAAPLWVAEQRGHLICNQGYILGLSQERVWTGGAVALLGMAIWLAWTSRTVLERVGWGIIFLGGASNFWERAWHGCVQDYFMLPLGPAFNLADIAVSLGALLCLFSLFASIPSKRWS